MGNLELVCVELACLNFAEWPRKDRLIQVFSQCWQAGRQAECVIDLELGRVMLVRVRLVFFVVVEWPRKNQLWDGVCRLGLASFAKRLCDQQGPPGAHYLVKAGQREWIGRKSLRERIDNLLVLELGAWSKQASENGMLT